jgi:hypothetical protein
MNKENMFKWYFGLIAVTATILLNSCASSPDRDRIEEDAISRKIKANTEARKFNRILLDAIQDSEKIVIREHSDKLDFHGIVPELETPPEYTYATKELTTAERILFLEEVMVLRGVAKNGNVNSLFTPRHTIDFYEQGTLKSSMKISFNTLTLQWNATNKKESRDVFQALSAVIGRTGMQTNRAWDAVARQRFTQGNQVQQPGLEGNQGANQGANQGVNQGVNPSGVPVAKWAPEQAGKKVINPFTGKLVDVQGIPANTKVRDPNDPDPTHVFKVPAM